MTVRESMYGIISADATLAGLGFAEENVYANAAPDSPPESGAYWMVLKWGQETPGLRGQRGRSRTGVWLLTFWFYARERDYGVINSAVKRMRDVMDQIEQVGPILCTSWQEDGEDGYDDVYQAAFRTSTYTIVANGD